MELCSPSPRLDEYIQGGESQEYIQGGNKQVQCVKLYILYMYMGYHLSLCLYIYKLKTQLQNIAKNITYVYRHVYLGAFKWNTPNVFLL